MRTRAGVVVGLVVAVLTMAPTDGVAKHGLTAGRVKIGLHAPFTGAAPLPSQSTEQGASLYWEWLKKQGREINRRNVEAVVQNDNYNPSQAVAVCKELVEEHHVFLLAGVLQATGSDQIQACARYAASVGVPYLSLGTSEIGVDRLPRYFSLNSSWPRQSRLLADYLVTDLKARREKNGMLRYGTPNFEDSHDAFVAAMRNRNAPLDYDRSISKNSGQSEAQTVVAEMKAVGIDNVFVLTSPVFFLQLTQAARTHDYHPLWTGIGITMTVGDSTASIGCRNGNMRRARFLSPIPAFADRDDFDRKHDRAMQAVYDKQGDSMTWLGWSASVAIRKVLENAGRDLGRHKFAQRTERKKNFVTGILPRFGYRPNDHLGGRGTHVLKADCTTRRWVTIRRFVGDF